MQITLKIFLYLEVSKVFSKSLNQIHTMHHYFLTHSKQLTIFLNVSILYYWITKIKLWKKSISFFKIGQFLIVLKIKYHWKYINITTGIIQNSLILDIFLYMYLIRKKTKNQCWLHWSCCAVILLRYFIHR